MKMYPQDWRIRLTSAVGVAICMSLAIFLGPNMGVQGLLPGGLIIVAAILVGNLGGLLVGRRIFRMPTDKS